MKIHVVSDIHLEMGTDFLPKAPESDTLVLSGDICVAKHLEVSISSPYYDNRIVYEDFFNYCSSSFDNVIYVMGNHEHYTGRFNNTSEIIRDFLSKYNNVHFLDNESVIINDFRFIGSTLWTDNNQRCPITEMTIKNGMNDYRIIQYFDGKHYRKLQPFDTAKFHLDAKFFIREEAIKSNEPVIVVGHHAPSVMSVHENYKDDYYFNGAYHSRLEEFILDIPNIKLWTHGHMHNACDYMIGNTRVVCNPYGYPGQTTGYNEYLVIEV